MKSDEEIRKKIFVLRLGVGIFVAIIAVLWLSNLVFSVNHANNSAPLASPEWQAELSSSLNDFRQNMNNNSPSNFLNDLQTKIEGEASSSSASSSPEEMASSSPEKMISDLANKLTASSSCPAYINCMPSIGEPRPCVIPPGCEKITQIAY